MTPRERILFDALKDILERVKDAPTFDEDCFERRDIKELCEIGGDICDTTMIAIVANDAMRKFEEAEP